jgi:hypothetical protein
MTKCMVMWIRQHSLPCHCTLSIYPQTATIPKLKMWMNNNPCISYLTFNA